MSTTVTTGKIRFSFVKVFAPSIAPGSDKAKYSVSVIVDKNDTATLQRINAAIAEAKEIAKGKWGGKLPAKIKTPLRDGDEERPDDPAYQGKYFFNCSCSEDRKPGVVDANLNPIIDPDEFYSGCYGRVNVNFYPFDHNGSKGIAAGLNHVQKLEDGERLGGGAPSITAAFADDASLFD